MLCALVCVLGLGSGCSAVRSVLRPMVCECERDADSGSADEFAEEDHLHEEDGGELEEEEGDEGDALATEDEAPEPEDTDWPDEALAEPELAPVEVVVADALVPAPDREARAEDYAIPSLPAGSHLLTGEFTRKPGAEAFVLIPNDVIAVYGESGRVARERLPLSVHDAFPPATLAVADPSQPVQAVDLVRDGTRQVAVATLELGDDGRAIVWLTILKTIGGRVGRIFRAPLATVGDGGYEPVGRVDFLRGRQHRVLRYTPLDGGEASGWSEPQIFRWNRWEGVYRIPGPPPTAPRSKQPVSGLSADWPRHLASTGPIG